MRLYEAALRNIAEKFNSMRVSEKLIENLEMSVITNGLMLNEERLRILKEISDVSKDG